MKTVIAPSYQEKAPTRAFSMIQPQKSRRFVWSSNFLPLLLLVGRCWWGGARLEATPRITHQCSVSSVSSVARHSAVSRTRHQAPTVHSFKHKKVPQRPWMRVVLIGYYNVDRVLCSVCLHCIALANEGFQPIDSSTHLVQCAFLTSDQAALS